MLEKSQFCYQRWRMRGVLTIFLLCSVAVHDVFSREITRPKRYNPEFENGWDWAWGYFEVDDTATVIRHINSSSEYSWKIENVPEVVYPFVSEKISLPTPNTTTPSLNVTIETKSNDAPPIGTESSTISSQTSDEPVTSSMKPDTVTTTSTTEANAFPISMLTTSSTEEISTDNPNILESKTTESSDTSTANDRILIKSVDAQLAEIRLANTTEEIPVVSSTTNITSETTTESKKTESTTQTVNDACAPLPGKPDFSAPGRRISEEQCMGYVWELKNRIKQNKWNLLCKRRLYVSHAVGGRKTEIGEFPHMGAVGWKAAIGTWVFKCGSSLISANFVMTAAHCVQAPDKDSSIADPVPKIVRLGDKNILDKRTIFTSPTDANIINILVHPEHHSPSKYFDIALMELEDPVQFTRFIQPACLWNSFSTGEPDHEATLTGWGVVESGSRDYSPELQAATVNVLDSAQCDKLLKRVYNRNWHGFEEHQLCAGKLAGGVDSCQGDSGGPLQMKMPLPNDITEEEGHMHYVIGIISFGVGCAHPNLPGVYTRVSSFIDWIEDNVWKNGHNRTYVEPPPSDIITVDSLPEISFGRRG